MLVDGGTQVREWEEFFFFNSKKIYYYLYIALELILKIKLNFAIFFKFFSER